jgi:hypothetical protein
LQKFAHFQSRVVISIYGLPQPAFFFFLKTWLTTRCRGGVNSIKPPILNLNLPKTTTLYFFGQKTTTLDQDLSQKSGGFGAKCGGFLSKKHKVVAFGKFSFQNSGFMLLTRRGDTSPSASGTLRRLLLHFGRPKPSSDRVMRFLSTLTLGW